MIIYKYPLTTGSQKIKMPMNSKILHVDQVQNRMYMWAFVHPMIAENYRDISVYATGDLILKGEYIGTVLTYNGQLVWHVFDNGEVND